MNKATWAAVIFTALLVVAAQAGGYLAYQKFSHMFSSGVKGASSSGQCPRADMAC